MDAHSTGAITAAERAGGEPQPPPRGRVPVAGQHQGTGQAPWAYYWLLLRKYSLHILTFAAVVTVAATLFEITRPKAYESVATIQIGAVGAQVVGDNNILRGQGLGSESEMLTEETVLGSPAVLLGVIQQLHLQQNAEFEDRAHPDSPPSVESVLRQLSAHLSIGRPPGSLLLAAQYRASQPALAAEIANAVVQSYLRLEYSSRADALTQSSQYMTGQLDQLRAKMENSQEALVDYAGRTDTLDPDNKNNIMAARLGEINTDLSKAQNQRMQLEAQVRLIRAGAPGALATSPLEEQVRPLRQNLEDDQRKLAALAQIYGPKHPLLLQQQRQVEHDQAMLSEAETRVASQIQSQYQAAALQEKLLGAALEQQKVAMDSFNRRAVKYHGLQASATAYTKLYYDMLQSIAESNIAAGFHATNARLVSAARPIYLAVYPRPKLVGAIALLGSLLLGVAVVIGIGAMDQTVATAEQAEMLFQLPVAGALPLSDGREGASAVVLASYGGGSGVASRRLSALQEAVLSMQSALLLAAAEAPQVLAVTSSLPAEGKSTVAAHLGLALASMGERVLLVDGDLRKPSLHRKLRISNRVGLVQVLRGAAELDDAIQRPGGEEGPSVLPSGGTLASPVESLHLCLDSVLDRLRTRFDRIVIDCPPVLGFADAGVIASRADAVLLVVRAGQTERSHVVGALRQLQAAGRGGALSIVLNCVSGSIHSYYNFYHSYGANYYENSESDDAE